MSEIDSPARGPYVPAVPTRDAITLRGMRFHARIGILPHEAELPQPLEVDLTVFRPRRDDGGASGILDYRELYELVAGIVGSGHLHYLEDVAEAVAEMALGMDRVEVVRVAVRKPHVALPGPLECAEVVIERERRDETTTHSSASSAPARG